MTDKGSRRSRSWMLASITVVSVASCSLDGCVVGKDLKGTPQLAENRGSKPGEGEVKVKAIRTIKLDAPPYATIMAWSSDSQRIAVGGSLDRRVSVWDVRTGQRLPGPGDQNGGPQALAYSPDGLYLAVARGGLRFRGDAPGSTGPERYVVSLWDARSGARVQNLVDETQEIQTFGVSSIVFSPDSRHFAVNYTGGLAFYAKDGEVWRRAGALAPTASRMAFSPDGTRLIGTTGNELLAYEVPSGRVVARWPGLRHGIESGLRSLAYRPDGGQIAVGEGPRLGFFDPSTGALRRILEPAPPYFVKGLSYSANSLYVALGVASIAQIVDVEEFATTLTLTEHRQYLEGLSLSPDGTLLAAIGGPVITLWQISGLQETVSE